MGIRDGEFGLRTSVSQVGEELPKYGYTIIGIVGGLLLWELAGYVMPAMTFEPFSGVVTRWLQFIESGELIPAIIDSLEHTVIGFGLAVVVGIPLGFVMGRKEEVYWALDGPLSALYATPIVALVPLIAVWFGLALVGKVVIVFIMAFIELTVNVFQGIREASDEYDNVAQSFGASRLQTYRYVLLPAILPFLFAGLRLAIGRAVRGMIVAELFLQVSGIGSLLVSPMYKFSVGAQLALIGTVTLIGIVAQGSVQQLRKRLVHWPAEVGRG